MRTALAVVALLAACTSNNSTPPPSCQEAFAHYYGAGCFYKDLSTGATITQDDITNRCQSAASSGPSSGCLAALNMWLVCNDSVPTPSTTAAQCDCSQEQMAVLTCK